MRTSIRILRTHIKCQAAVADLWPQFSVGGNQGSLGSKLAGKVLVLMRDPVSIYVRWRVTE